MICYVVWVKNLQKEFGLWFEQAKYDLKAARDSLKSKNYEWTPHLFYTKEDASKCVEYAETVISTTEKIANI